MTEHNNVAITMARVSSKDQEDNHSLPAQEERAIEYCQSMNLQILRQFRITESSTQGNRKLFKGMMDFARRQKTRIIIVADTIDRIQRDFKELIELDELRLKGKIELHFCRDHLVINDHSQSHEIMAWYIKVLLAKAYIESLRDNVKRSINYKLKHGEWIGDSPIGYISRRDANDKSEIILDDDRAFLVNKVYDLYATGLYSLSDITAQLQDMGLKTKRNKTLTKTHLHRILTNPFYYGEMLVKGTLYPHKHPRIITREVFDICQDILHGRNNGKHRHFKNGEKPFIFRGLVKCGVCGKTMCSDLKTKPNGKQYTYLFCSHQKRRDLKVDCKNKAINEQSLIGQVTDVLKKLKMPEEVATFIKADLEEFMNAEAEFHSQQLNMLRKQYDKNQEKLGRLRHYLLENALSLEEFNQTSNELKAEQYELEQKLSNHTHADERFSIALSSVVSLANNAYNYFQSGNIEEQRTVIKTLFSNLSLTDGELSYDLVPPFGDMLNLDDGYKWRT